MTTIHWIDMSVATDAGSIRAFTVIFECLWPHQSVVATVLVIVEALIELDRGTNSRDANAFTISYFIVAGCRFLK